MKVALILWLFLPVTIYSQDQELKVLSHNILFGTVTSGVGAIINKKSGENWKRSFVRGCWQGSIGGLVNYASKKTIYLVDKNDNLGYAIPARLINAAGNSIIQNAASNGPFLKNWNFEYGFLRFDYYGNAEKKLRIRLLPEALVAAGLSMPQGKFDINTSLLTGVLAFKSDEFIATPNGSKDGVNYGRAFTYVDDSLKYHLVSHEVIHEYQYREYLVFNAYLGKEVAKLKETRLKKILTKYIYPDIPYFGLFYMIQGNQPPPDFYKNYFEFEAERFATNQYVPTH